MIVAVDIGATKTLVVTAQKNGKILTEIKFYTPKEFAKFIEALVQTINDSVKESISIISVGTAGQINRKSGTILYSPNLGWFNAPLKQKLAEFFPKVPIIVENDANLAGLAEANNLKNIEQKVMYITFSTGIGTGFVTNGQLDASLLDSEGGHMVFEYKGKITNWESYAAGRLIPKKYGKMASEIDDKRIWKEITKNMAIGIINCCAIYPANTVIIGGSVGTYFKKYSQFLNDELTRLSKKSIMIRKPTIVGAKNAEKAVILGCIFIATRHEQHR